MSQHLRLRKRPAIILPLFIVLAAGMVFSSAYANSSVTKETVGNVTALEQPGDSVGYTYLDLQTQQSMPERLVYDPVRKDVQMVWMADTETLAANSLRGSYLSVIDVSKEVPSVVELPLGWKRIETRKANWPSIGGFSDGSVGISSHAPLLYNTNLPGSYTAFTTLQKNVDGAVYIRSAIDGNDIVHVIFAYSGGANEGQLGYMRSTDKGQTWSDGILLTGATAPGGSIPGIAGFDCYAIAAAGSKVAVVYADKAQRLWRRLSTDNGQTWGAAVVIAQPPVDRVYHTLGSLGEDSVVFVSDTVQTPGTQMDVIFDSQGKSYVVFAMTPTYIRGIGKEQGGSIVRIGRDTIAVDETRLASAGLGFIEEGKAEIVRMGPPAGGTWDGTGKFLSGGTTGTGYSCFPQLGVGANGEIYCVYTSVKNGDKAQITADIGGVATPVDALFGHIYATHRLPGREWSKPVDLTPAGMDCLYGTLANIVHDQLYIGYQSDMTPGIRTVHKTPLETTVVRFRALPVDQLNESPTVSVADPVRSIAAAAVVSIYPNPLREDGRLDLSLPVSGTVSIELYTVLGAKVVTLFNGFLTEGNHYIPFQIGKEGIPSGRYYCIVRTGLFTQSTVVTIIR